MIDADREERDISNENLYQQGLALNVRADSIDDFTKAWGINHYRFHSWCPPKAAFEAADELGGYFQAELPNKRGRFREDESLEAAYWNIDRLDIQSTETNVSHFDYTKREGELIFRYILKAKALQLLGGGYAGF